MLANIYNIYIYITNSEFHIFQKWSKLDILFMKMQLMI